MKTTVVVLIQLTILLTSVGLLRNIDLLHMFAPVGSDVYGWLGWLKSFDIDPRWRGSQGQLVRWPGSW
jgi:hypothetical protein